MRRRASLAVYTFSHFCVDFACFFMLFAGFKSRLTGEAAAAGFLLYNILAFGLQPPIGYLCDAGKNSRIGSAGCALLLLGLAFFSSAWFSLVLCALGNACFHVGGGIDSLVHADGKMARSGVFVSSGALGVSLGALAGQSGAVPLYAPILLIALCGVLLLFFDKGYSERPAMQFRVAKELMGVPWVLVLCLVSVMVRAYVGAALPIAWKTTALLALIPGAASCAGKAAGGFLADRFGARRTGIVTLLLSAPLLCLGYGDPVLCATGLVLFNVIMPIALCAVASALPHNPGLSFGLTTLGLLCGSAPTFFFVLAPSAVPAAAAACIAVSALCLFFATIDQERKYRHADSAL
ncbi:MAG: hypothetical protein ABFC62_03090 [Clostridiaceae bacterium]|nr:hypothetical protein [Eubacteriales bacterium]